MKFYLDELRLSPYTFSVYAALQEKCAVFNLHEVSFRNNRSLDAGFQSQSQTDLIPLLVDGDLALSESLAILEYLEEKLPPPQNVSLFPSDMKKRAQARMLLSWYRCGLRELRQERSSETMFYLPQMSAQSPLSSAAQEEVAEWLKFLTSLRTPGSPFMFGDEWSIADHETAFMLQRLIKNGDPVDEDLKRYADQIWERPSAKAFITHQRKPYQSYYQ